MDMSHSMSHSDMDMSGGGMAMTFNNNHNTTLFSNLWTPASDGAYAGTCIFLIILAIIDRSLIALKAVLERRWHAAHMNRRYITIAGKTSEAGRIDADRDAKFATLITPQGVEESVKMVQTTTDSMPWRFSTDLPRAVIFFFIVGVSNLLMLAVMTMNVGYFFSVLAGAFIGELTLGRFIQGHDENHH